MGDARVERERRTDHACRASLCRAGVKRLDDVKAGCLHLGYPMCALLWCPGALWAMPSPLACDEARVIGAR